MTERVDSKLIKTINERRLLNLIRENGPISRNELSKKSKISKVTVSEIINRLNDAGFILEIGKGKSTKKGGKRPTLLKLNPEAGYVIGVEIKHGRTYVALANIESEIKAMERIGYGVGASIDEVIPSIFKTIDSILIKNNIIEEKLTSIGIGLPGFIDYKHGELIFADTLHGWANLPLASRFSRRYNVPTILENDVNTITLGESLIGAGRGTSNLVCIWIGEGVGSGIMVDNHLIRGETGNAGEIGYLELGHFVANTGIVKDLYTNQRYFGEILSEVNLFDTLKMKLQWNKTRNDESIQYSTLEEILNAGDQGNRIVQDILDEYAYLLMIICMHLIKTINPSLIILSGRVNENSHYLIEKVRQLVKQSIMNMPFEPSTIVVGQLKDSAGVKGAIALALQTIFEPPLSKRKNHVQTTS